LPCRGPVADAENGGKAAPAGPLTLFFRIKPLWVRPGILSPRSCAIFVSFRKLMQTSAETCKPEMIWRANLVGSGA
jgi:hypothetical protein